MYEYTNAASPHHTNLQADVFTSCRSRLAGATCCSDTIVFGSSHALMLTLAREIMPLAAVSRMHGIMCIMIVYLKDDVSDWDDVEGEREIKRSE